MPRAKKESPEEDKEVEIEEKKPRRKKKEEIEEEEKKGRFWGVFILLITILVSLLFKFFL